MKFTMNDKELKSMIEKVTTVICKKSSVQDLTKIYFQVESDGAVKVYGTDMDQHIEIKSSNTWNTIPGILGIDIDDIKIILKMNSDVTLEDISIENHRKLNVCCGKKMVTIPCYNNTDMFLPCMDDTKTHILSIEENWLQETLVNLSLFLSKTSSNQMMNTFHFNTQEKRIEALDSHRIGTRSLENQKIITTTDNPFTNIKLHAMCIPVFKKVLNKKSNEEVKVYQDKKYISIEGKDFTYMQRKIDGEYFKIKQLLKINDRYSFCADRKNMLDVVKYNADIIKQEKVPMVFHSENGHLYSILKSSKYETFDEITTENNTMGNELIIGFNPLYMLDVLSVVDLENPVFNFDNNKSPVIIDGNEYKFLVLPIKIKEIDEYKNEFDKKISKAV